MNDISLIRPRKLWNDFKSEHFSFWMISFYLFFEYSRPQAIFPAIDFMPWAQTFLLAALMGMVLDKTVVWVRHPANALMIWLAIVTFVSGLTAYYPEISKNNYINFYGWFVVYFLIINIVNTRKRYYIFLIIFILSAAKIAIGDFSYLGLQGIFIHCLGPAGAAGVFSEFR